MRAIALLAALLAGCTTAPTITAPSVTVEVPAHVRASCPLPIALDDDTFGGLTEYTVRWITHYRRCRAAIGLTDDPAIGDIKAP